MIFERGQTLRNDETLELVCFKIIAIDTFVCRLSRIPAIHQRVCNTQLSHLAQCDCTHTQFTHREIQHQIQTQMTQTGYSTILRINLQHMILSMIKESDTYTIHMMQAQILQDIFLSKGSSCIDQRQASPTNTHTQKPPRASICCQGSNLGLGALYKQEVGLERFTILSSSQRSHSVAHLPLELVDFTILYFFPRIFWLFLGA